MYLGDICFAQHDKSLGSAPNAGVRAEDRPCQMEISSRGLNKVWTNMLNIDKKMQGPGQPRLFKIPSHQTRDKKRPHQHTFSCGTYYLSNQFWLNVSHPTNWYYLSFFYLVLLLICLSQLVQMIWSAYLGVYRNSIRKQNFA